MGNLTEASDHYRNSLAIASSVGDRLWAANARCNLGLLLSESGQATQAETELLAVVDEARDLGQPTLEATAACNLGILLLATARASEAAAHLQYAANMASTLSDPTLEAQCQRELGKAHAQSYEWQSARRAFTSAADLALQAGDQAEAARAYCEIAALDACCGDDLQARHWIAKARVAIEQLSGQNRDELEVLLALADQARAGTAL